MQKRVNTVKTLLDALPFIKEFSNQTIVIKYGGAAQINPQLKEQFAIDIVLMYLVGINPVIVHGGGNRISEVLKALNIQSEFVNGHRITCAESMKVVDMVLSGEVNKEIVSFLNVHGAKAIGISGKDASFMKAKAKDNGEYGYTGSVTSIEPNLINDLVKDGFIPVIAPTAASEEANHPGFNINADTAASEIAVAIGAKRVIFLTDTLGVLDQEGKLIESLTRGEIGRLKEEGVIKGGMIPKVDACLRAVEGGVQKAHIIDGRVEHSLILELFTSEGIGTEITEDTKALLGE